MFDIGFPELILIAIVGLLVIGPERLPEALRTLGLWLGRMRRSFMTVKNEIEKEIGMDEIRRQLHNESVMEEMKRIETEVRTTASETSRALNEATIHPGPDSAAEPATKDAPETSDASTPVNPADDARDTATGSEPQPHEPDGTSDQHAENAPPSSEANA